MPQSAQATKGAAVMAEISVKVDSLAAENAALIIAQAK